MKFNLPLTTATHQIVLWTLKHAAASRLLMSAMPLTLALAMAVAHRNPALVAHHLHIAPACGSNSGGGGGC